jgi:hypothetical protein
MQTVRPSIWTKPPAYPFIKHKTVKERSDGERWRPCSDASRILLPVFPRRCEPGGLRSLR